MNASSRNGTLVAHPSLHPQSGKCVSESLEYYISRTFQLFLRQGCTTFNHFLGILGNSPHLMCKRFHCYLMHSHILLCCACEGPVADRQISTHNTVCSAYSACMQFHRMLSCSDAAHCIPTDCQMHWVSVDTSTGASAVCSILCVATIFQSDHRTYTKHVYIECFSKLLRKWIWKWLSE